ncbi:MAG: DUF2520 domain-containing protein [Chloroflexi bacterium]|nr:DUF2520 domain-containing protein [Chloroflexota bacterium]
MRSIGFIGAGTVGSALAISLHRRDYPVVALASRSLASAQRLGQSLPDARVFANPQDAASAADFVFLTVPDDAIASVATSLRWRPGQAALHCSGSLSLDVLDAASRQGASVGAIHPLQTFASVENAIQNLPGSTFALETLDEGLMAELEGIARALDGEWIHLGPGDKVLYHASAVLACNYFVTLVKLATDLWQDFGVSPDQATGALMPLLRGTVSNIEKVGLPNCLTGPIARGDVGTIEKHIDALAARAPETLRAYQEMGRQTIPIALAKGKLSPEAAAVLIDLLGHSPNESHDEMREGETKCVRA